MLLLAACTTWNFADDLREGAGKSDRLSGNTVALLGELHDDAALHQKRFDLLRLAIQAGWRPALVMEQFDIDRQADIDRARSERPGDAPWLIARASPARSGWNWTHYQPLVALALEFNLPLLAGNLSRADAGRLIRNPPEDVLGAARVRELGLDTPRDPAWQHAQERVIDDGHCGLFPADLLPGMARAQFARDAVMADVLRRHMHRGVVLLAGNGHVRRDLGVPRWLADVPPARLWVVGFLPEAYAAKAEWARLYDTVVTVRRDEHSDDPCKQLSAPAAHR